MVKIFVLISFVIFFLSESWSRSIICVGKENFSLKTMSKTSLDSFIGVLGCSYNNRIFNKLKERKKSYLHFHADVFKDKGKYRKGTSALETYCNCVINRSNLVRPQIIPTQKDKEDLKKGVLRDIGNSFKANINRIIYSLARVEAQKNFYGLPDEKINVPDCNLGIIKKNVQKIIDSGCGGAKTQEMMNQRAFELFGTDIDGLLSQFTNNIHYAFNVDILKKEDMGKEQYLRSCLPAQFHYQLDQLREVKMMDKVFGPIFKIAKHFKKLTGKDFMLRSILKKERGKSFDDTILSYCDRIYGSFRKKRRVTKKEKELLEEFDNSCEEFGDVVDSFNSLFMGTKIYNLLKERASFVKFYDGFKNIKERKSSHARFAWIIEMMNKDENDIIYARKINQSCKNAFGFQQGNLSEMLCANPRPSSPAELVSYLKDNEISSLRGLHFERLFCEQKREQGLSNREYIQKLLPGSKGKEVEVVRWLENENDNYRGLYDIFEDHKSQSLIIKRNKVLCSILRNCKKDQKLCSLKDPFALKDSQAYKGLTAEQKKEIDYIIEALRMLRRDDMEKKRSKTEAQSPSIPQNSIELKKIQGGGPSKKLEEKVVQRESSEISIKTKKQGKLLGGGGNITKRKISHRIRDQLLMPPSQLALPKKSKDVTRKKAKKTLVTDKKPSLKKKQKVKSEKVALYERSSDLVEEKKTLTRKKQREVPALMDFISDIVKGPYDSTDAFPPEKIRLKLMPQTRRVEGKSRSQFSIKKTKWPKTRQSTSFYKDKSTGYSETSSAHRPYKGPVPTIIPTTPVDQKSLKQTKKTLPYASTPTQLQAEISGISKKSPMAQKIKKASEYFNSRLQSAKLQEKKDLKDSTGKKSIESRHLRSLNEIPDDRMATASAPKIPEMQFAKHIGKPSINKFVKKVLSKDGGDVFVKRKFILETIDLDGRKIEIPMMVKLDKAGNIINIDTDFDINDLTLIREISNIKNKKIASFLKKMVEENIANAIPAQELLRLDLKDLEKKYRLGQETEFYVEVDTKQTNKHLYYKFIIFRDSNDDILEIAPKIKRRSMIKDFEKIRPLKIINPKLYLDIYERLKHLDSRGIDFVVVF